MTDNLPYWFTEKGYWISMGRILPIILYYREQVELDSVEVARWNWIPSVTEVVETIKEYENEKSSRVSE